jgi:hypothetical protein
MKADGFGRSLAFAAIAGIAWPAVALVAGPTLGTRAALALYLVASAAVYAGCLATSRVRAIGAALVAALIGAAFAVAGLDLAAVALGAAVGLGVARSGVVFRTNAARALAVEALLLGGGLALARFLASPTLLGAALAIWGFGLVQSAFFAIGGMRERSVASDGLDRFERARRRAAELLGDDARA